MRQNLVSGLHYLVNVLVQNFSISIMTRFAQNMQARILSQGGSWSSFFFLLNVLLLMRQETHYKIK